MREDLREEHWEDLRREELTSGEWSFFLLWSIFFKLESSRETIFNCTWDSLEFSIFERERLSNFLRKWRARGGGINTGTWDGSRRQMATGKRKKEMLEQWKREGGVNFLQIHYYNLRSEAILSVLHFAFRVGCTDIGAIRTSSLFCEPGPPLPSS